MVIGEEHFSQTQSCNTELGMSIDKHRRFRINKSRSGSSSYGDAVRPGNYIAQLNMADHSASTAQLTVCSLRAVIIQEGLRQAEDADGK